MASSSMQNNSPLAKAGESYSIIKNSQFIRAARDGSQLTIEAAQNFAATLQIVQKNIDRTWAASMREMFLKPGYNENNIMKALIDTNNEAVALVLTGAILAKTLGVENSINIKINQDEIKVFLTNHKNNRPAYPNKKPYTPRNNTKTHSNDGPSIEDVKNFAKSIMETAEPVAEPTTPTITEPTTPVAEQSAETN